LPILGQKESGEGAQGEKKIRSSKVDRPKEKVKKEIQQIQIHYRLYKPAK